MTNPTNTPAEPQSFDEPIYFIERREPGSLWWQAETERLNAAWERENWYDNGMTKRTGHDRNDRVEYE